MLPIDVTNDASVKAAAEIVTSSGEPLYGLVSTIFFLHKSQLLNEYVLLL